MMQLDSIGYHIDGREILSGISVEIPSASHLLICGPSGCGKSTLMHIMAGVLRPTEGDVIFNETKYSDLSEGDMDALRGDNFGFIFQRLHLIGHLTVACNIAIAAKTGQGKQDAYNVLKMLGVDHVLKQNASSLSVGEAQRVAIARAVANEPKIIFADEPTSALDNDNAKRVMDFLFAYAKDKGISLVVTSHDDRIQSLFGNKLELSHE